MVDLINRDPNDINGHVKGEFEDILAEPEGIRSIGCIWSLAYKCFGCGRDLCYKLATLLCGLCMALGWGCTFAGMALKHVWCITPCFMLCEMNCSTMRKMYAMCINCCLGPWCETCALCCSKIKDLK